MRTLAMAENAGWNEPGEHDPANLQTQQMAGHIRRRPRLFIGDTGPTGLDSLAYELVGYSLEELSSGHGKSIHVRINGDGSLSVADDGRGIPVEMHVSAEITILEWVMTVSTGVEVRGAERVFRTNLHGMGARAVTALSDWAEAVVCCCGRVYRQRYQRGLPAGDVCDIGPAGSQTGTKITFHPDPEIFHDATFDRERLAARLRELAFLNKGLTIQLTDECGGKEEALKFDGSLLEFVQFLDRSEDVLQRTIYVDKTVRVDGTLGDIRVEAAIRYTACEGERARCYTNNAYNPVGGTHLVGFRKAVTRTVNAYGKKENLLKDGLTPSGRDTREGMTAVVSVRVPEPQFESNNKLRLNNPEVEGAVAGVINECLAAWLEENPRDARRVIRKAVATAKIRKARRPARPRKGKPGGPPE